MEEVVEESDARKINAKVLIGTHGYDRFYFPIGCRIIVFNFSGALLRGSPR